MRIAILIPNDQFWCEEYGDNSFLNKEKKFPYSLAAAAAHLRNNGMEVFVIDAQAEKLNVKQVQNRIKNISPKLIVIRINPLNIDFDVQQVVECKKHCSFNLVGLIYDDFAKDAIKRCPAFDAVIRREWAQSLLEISQCIKSKEPIYNVKGITYQTKEGIKTNSAMPHINVNSLPSPAFDLFPMKKYDYYSVLISHGCSHNCLFCHFGYYPDSGWEARDIDKIIFEIKDMLRFGNKHFVFMTYELTGDIQFSKKLFKCIIEEGIKISFECSLRASIVDEELYELIDKAGCTMIFFGIESGVQEVLDWNNKKLELKDVKKAYNLLEKRNMSIKVFFMVGLLGDTQETIKKTFDFVTKELKVKNTSFDIAIPYPDTGLFKLMEKNGWIEKFTLDNLIWIHRNLYNWQPLLHCVGEKPNWRIQDMSFDEILDVWKQYYPQIPKGNDLDNLKILFRKGPFYWNFTVRHFLHNPIGNLKRVKNIFKNLL